MNATFILLSSPRWLLILLLLSFIGSNVPLALAFAQGPVIVGVSPTRNQADAPPAANVVFNFDFIISSGPETVGSLKVFSQQRGGRMQNGAGGTTTVGNRTLTFDPAINFGPASTSSLPSPRTPRAASGRIWRKPTYMALQ